MVTVIFPAAGRGSRMGISMNKAFLDLEGVPMLLRTMRKFSATAAIDSMIVAVAEEEVALTRMILTSDQTLKPWQVTAGGSERQYSIANALKILPEDTDVVLVHDAARPFVGLSVIENVVDAAREFGGAIAAVPETNTIKAADADGFVIATPDRRNLWEVQTPQGFRKDIILAAYEKATLEKFLGTDDASLVERLQNARVKIVQSDYRNIKITTPEDLAVAKAFLQA